MIERSSELEREIASLEAVRRRLRRDVALLGTEPPDADLVEEQAAGLLGFIRPGDVVVTSRR